MTGFRDARGRFISHGKAFGGAGAVLSLNAAEWKRCQRKMADLPRNLARKVLDKALRESMRPVLKAARASAPVESGATKRAVTIKLSRRQPDGSRGAAVGIFRPPQTSKKYKDHPYYASFGELGTSRQAAKPWLRPALEINRANVINLFGTRLKVGLEALAKQP